MNIKDVEKRTNLTKSNIRYYEDAGLITPMRDVNNNYRKYTEADIIRLEQIKTFRLLGINIEEIREYFHGERTLEEILRGRLDQIQTDADLLRRQAEVCRDAIERQATDISEVRFDQKGEIWQRRLMMMLRDDIVQHRLSRTEFNRDLLWICISARLLSLVSAFLLTGLLVNMRGMSLGTFADMEMSPVVETGLAVSILLLIGLGMVPHFSANVTTHATALYASAAAEPLVLICIAQSHLVPVMYTGLLILALLCWGIARMSEKAIGHIGTALVLCVLYTASIVPAAPHFYESTLSLTQKAALAAISVIVSLCLTVTWSQVNRETRAFTRYLAFVTGHRMVNVVGSFNGALGYSGPANVVGRGR